MLEAAQWEQNAFCTLTYDPEKCPVDLMPEHLTLFMKRLRIRWSSMIRFYACGEYSPTLRPHFHLALFNFPTCQHTGFRRGDCPCQPCSAVRKSWTFGHIMLGSLEERSARYIAGYVLKKADSQSSERLRGLRPEFSRMSLRPGVGAGATWDVASVLMQYPSIIQRAGDVPHHLRHGIRKLPFGPYLKRLTRIRVGLDGKAPERSLEAAREKVRPLFEFAAASAPPACRRAVVKAYIGEWNDQYNRNIAARRKESLQ